MILKASSGVAELSKVIRGPGSPENVGRVKGVLLGNVAVDVTVVVAEVAGVVAVGVAVVLGVVVAVGVTVVVGVTVAVGVAVAISVAVVVGVAVAVSVAVVVGVVVMVGVVVDVMVTVSVRLLVPAECVSVSVSTWMSADVLLHVSIPSSSTDTSI